MVPSQTFEGEVTLGIIRFALGLLNLNRAFINTILPFPFMGESHVVIALSKKSVKLKM
jgi:hypothetical protein